MAGRGTGGKKISIHAPRTGSDTRNRRKEGQGNISTHAPRTGSDVLPLPVPAAEETFQPTLPARGATPAVGG